MALHQRVRESPPEKQRKAAGRAAHRDGKRRNWSLLSAQGRVLFYVAVCPDSPVEEIARNLDLTERAIWGVVRDLRQHGLIHLRKRGRRHHYFNQPGCSIPSSNNCRTYPSARSRGDRRASSESRPEVCD